MKGYFTLPYAYVGGAELASCRRISRNSRCLASSSASCRRPWRGMHRSRSRSASWPASRFGIVLGRWLWILFVEQIGAVPAPTVPVLSVIVAAIVALVLANAAAVLPGWRAAHVDRTGSAAE